MKNEIILITGAAGSIGSALAKKVAELKPKKLILIDNDESGLFELRLGGVGRRFLGDVRDGARMAEIFEKFKPTLVFHAAAYKHVSMSEENPVEVMKVNIDGTLNLLTTALNYGVNKFVNISSDKAVNPESVMGMTKKITERFTRLFNHFSTKAKFVSVRFGNVMASRGSVIPIWNKQIAEGKPLTITNAKMKRYFMSIYDAVELVLVAAETKISGEEIFVLDMGEEMDIMTLANLIIKLSGKDVKTKVIGVRKGEKITELLYDPAQETLEKVLGKNGLLKAIPKV